MARFGVGDFDAGGGPEGEGHCRNESEEEEKIHEVRILKPLHEECKCL